MKKRPLDSRPTYDARVASLTGHHCPQTGWWLADEDLDQRFISEGDVMPAVNGRPTHWTPCAEVRFQGLRPASAASGTGPWQRTTAPILDQARPE